MNEIVNEQNESYFVRSDIDFVTNHVNKINSALNNSIDNNKQNHSFFSSNTKNNLYDSLNNIVSSYNKIGSMINDGLQQQMQINMIIAENIENLDKELEVKTNNL